MSHQRSGTKLKITRVFVLLVVLAALKLALFGVLGVETMTQTMVEAVAPIAGVEEAQAQAQAQSPAATPALQSETQTATANQAAADGAAPDGAVMDTKPAGMDDSDWKVLKKREEELAAKERSLTELEAQLNAKTVEIEKLNAQLRQLLDEAK
ncbi:MAG: magnesium transporter MgtE, partial [Proteobacteria bacterium]|nr:magnesium transporter MgtE [Pseudomonadota bacterium]